MKKVKLNLGCGNQTPAEWINVDYALGAQFFKLPPFAFINQKFKIFDTTWDQNIFIHDLRTQFPWSDNFADCVYSSHTLEHLNRDEGYHFLQECYRVLKQKGTIRIVVPDLGAIVAQYIEGEVAADEFVDNLEVSFGGKQDRFWKRLLAPLIHFPHKCMYDTKTLIRTMSKIGFECSAAVPFESNITDIENIELPHRTEGAVIVEGKKSR